MENHIHFTLFGSGYAFLAMLIILLVLLFWSDIEEVGVLALVAFVVAIGLNQFFGDFPILSIITWSNVFLYVSVGFVFSLFRTYRKGRELSADKKKYFNLKDHVFRWWFLWPFSATNWIFGHMLGDIYSFLYDNLNILYQKVFNS